jgi:hypothetical protein
MTPDDSIVALQLVMDRTLREVLTAAYSKHSMAKAKALLALTTHIANNWTAICILHGNAISDERKQQVVANPITALGRCMYDALLQALYIAVDSAKTEERATDYLKFGAVEHCQFMDRLLGGTDWLCKRISGSSKRAAHEKAVRREYDRVKGRFADCHGRVRQHWYSGSLQGLAKAVGKEKEYIWHVTYSNSSVHAGAFAVSRGPLVPTGNATIFIAAAVACQAAALVVSELQIEVSEESKVCMAEFSVDLCNWSPPT